MTQLTFGYSDSEDRVWLASSDGPRFWLTRRLAVGLLGPACGLLERTVPGGDIPNALPTGQRILLEHQEALADSPEGRPALDKDKESRPAVGVKVSPPILATRITLQAESLRCALVITAGQETVRYDVKRIDLHRLLAALRQVTTKAGWDIGGLPDWLAG